MLKDIKFTKEEIQSIIDLAEPGELIPLSTFLAARLGEVTQEDIEWAKNLCQKN